MRTDHLYNACEINPNDQGGGGYSTLSTLPKSTPAMIYTYKLGSFIWALTKQTEDLWPIQELHRRHFILEHYAYLKINESKHVSNWVVNSFATGILLLGGTGFYYGPMSCKQCSGVHCLGLSLTGGGNCCYLAVCMCHGSHVPYSPHPRSYAPLVSVLYDTDCHAVSISIQHFIFGGYILGSWTT